ncbi:hypothetical protein OH77DRAFT_570155 [Trametes cingulata]|nr:hypothetical protein OH77DRAFT_570155 [Trametes cingulata]
MSPSTDPANPSLNMVLPGLAASIANVTSASVPSRRVPMQTTSTTMLSSHVSSTMSAVVAADGHSEPMAKDPVPWRTSAQIATDQASSIVGLISAVGAAGTLVVFIAVGILAYYYFVVRRKRRASLRAAAERPALQKRERTTDARLNRVSMFTVTSYTEFPRGAVHTQAAAKPELRPESSGAQGQNPRPPTYCSIEVPRATHQRSQSSAPFAGCECASVDLEAEFAPRASSCGEYPSRLSSGSIAGWNGR